MKKNFFKKLSFVLALAMVLSVLTNVGPVFAAAGPTLTASHKYLHLDREDMPNEYNFNIKNKKSGWKYEWTSADEDVVTINEKNGIVTATGAGTTTIYCAITDKDGNEIAVLDAKVTVRDNIKELTITNTPDGALNVGEEWDFNRSYVTYANRTKGSAAITRWTVDDEDNASITDKGVFVATKAGEYTIEARAFQSKSKYETWKDTKDEELVTSNVASFTVKVVAGMETPEQIDLRTVKVPFTSEVEDADKNLTLYVMIGSTKVKVATVKAVTLANDKKSANIELYTDFTPEATYVIEHPEMEAVQFIAAKTGADQVDSITLNTATATVKGWTDISYTLRDKNGVDITASVPADRVTVTATTSKGIFANKRLYFFNVGDTAEVTVKYNAYKWENGVDVGARSASGTVMAVEAAATNITGASAWTIVPMSTKAPDFANVKQILSVSDKGKRLFVELNKLVGTESFKISSADAIEEANFKYTTSDKSVLIIDNKGNLYPVKEGDVTIVVSYKDQVVAAIPVRVNAKREAVMIEPSTTAILLSNANVGDYKDVTFKAYDNFGEELEVKLEGFKKLAGSPESNIVTTVEGRPAYRFKGQGAAVGTYNYQVKVNGLFTYITVNVSAPATGGVEPSYVAEVTPGEVDLKTDGLADTNVTIKLYSYAGVVKQSAIAVTGEVFKVIVKDPKGNDTVLTTNNYTLVDVVSGGAITKKPVGTYTVTVQKEYDVDGTSYYYDVYVTTFTVKDTTEAPTVEVKTLQSDEKNLLQAIKDCFTFKLDNTEINEYVTNPKYIGDADGTDVYVVSVDYEQRVGKATLKHTIPVGLTITKKAAKTN
jgi:hypothetical protein